jgi:hypothetical protein
MPDILNCYTQQFPGIRGEKLSMVAGNMFHSCVIQFQIKIQNVRRHILHGGNKGLKVFSRLL